MIDKTFRAGEKFRPVRTETRKMQYLYDSGDAAVFMDTRDYEQLELPRDLAGDAMQWVRPNDDVEILFVDEQPDRRPGRERRRHEGHQDRSRAQGRHRLGRRHQAGDARDRGRGRGAAVHRTRASASASTRARASTSSRA